MCIVRVHVYCIACVSLCVCVRTYIYIPACVCVRTYLYIQQKQKAKSKNKK